MLNTFTKAQLKKIIRYYNLNIMIRGYSKMSYDELLNAIKKFMIIDENYNVFLIPQKTDLLLNEEQTKKLIKYKMPKSSNLENKINELEDELYTIRSSYPIPNSSNMGKMGTQHRIALQNQYDKIKEEYKKLTNTEYSIPIYTKISGKKQIEYNRKSNEDYEKNKIKEDYEKNTELPLSRGKRRGVVF